jgi:subtilisin family serine protease
MLLTTVAWGAPSEKAGGPPNGYIVQVVEGGNAVGIGRAVAARTNGKVGHVYSSALRGFSIQLPPGLARQAILGEPGVARVEPDIRVHAVAQTLPTGVDRIEADQNSTAKIDGVDERVNVDIAILDTGIDVDHPDLNVVGGRRFYTILWWSFEDDLYDDDNGHGTHCAGTAAAIDNGDGVVGVAPGARLWAVKVLDSTGGGYLSDLIGGVDWVTARAATIEVASMSLRAIARSDIFRTAIQNSVNAGVVYVAAAGNDARDVYGGDGVFPSSDDAIPAAYPEVATISALGDSDGQPGGTGSATSYGADDSFASFSNYSGSVVGGNPVTSPGLAIDLLMPGVGILSTYPGGGTATGSGTSMAAPHAAGLAALYIADSGRAYSAAGVYAIRQALIDAGMDQASGNRLAHPATEPDSYPENLGWAGGASGSVDYPPSAAVVDPADGQVLTGTCRILVSASDDGAVSSVELTIDGGAYTDITANFDGTYYYYDWDTTGASDGDHTLGARATDDASQSTDSAVVSVTVDNAPSDDAPSVSISDPSEGQTVAGSYRVLVSASDDHTLSSVELSIDGGAYMDITASFDDTYYYYDWDTTATSDGGHTLRARATDDALQSTDSAILSVTVDNAPPTTATMHVESIDVYTVNTGGGRKSGHANVVIVDSDGVPVEGATVKGTFSGDINESVFGTTGSDGRVVLFTDRTKKGRCKIAFCVEDVSDALTYEPSFNNETCDQNY